MKAVVMYETGSPDVLKYEDVETPKPGEGQVLDDVRDASLGQRFVGSSDAEAERRHEGSAGCVGPDRRDTVDLGSLQDGQGPASHATSDVVPGVGRVGR